MPYGINYKRIKCIGNMFVVKPVRAVFLLRILLSKKSNLVQLLFYPEEAGPSRP